MNGARGLWELLAGPVYRRQGLMTPPITGDPYSLSLPGQSRAEMAAMWAKYMLGSAVATFAALMCVGLLAYPVALTVRWLILHFQ